MTYLVDNSDPTTALFLSDAAVAAAGMKVMLEHTNVVDRVYSKMRKRRGENLGYALMIVRKDDPSFHFPLTNSDAERLLN